MQSDYSEIRIIGAGADAVDFALVNSCHTGDVVVTQDYGCEERSGAMPVQAIAVLLGDDGIEKSIRMPDVLFYERALEAGDRVCLDTDGTLRKAIITKEFSGRSCN